MNKFIQIHDKTIHIQWLNYSTFSNDKPVLVFLHEALGSIPQWRTFPSTLCNELKLPGIIIERSGHGQSSPLSSPRKNDYLHQYTEETKACLHELLPPTQAIILIGHSDGGSIALLLGIKPQLNIRGIITMAAHTFVETITLDGIKKAVEAYHQGKLAGLEKYHADKTENLFNAWADTWLSSDFAQWDIREEILSIELPILALQGNGDQYGTEKQMDSIERISSKASTVMLSNCAHHPHIEQEKIVVQQIANWVQNHAID